MKIKEIKYKIINGKWKSKLISDKHGRYTYPVLITVIEDINNNLIEIPLSYNQCAEILEKQIFLERYVDKNYERRPYSQKVIDGINFILNNAKNKDINQVESIIKSLKEKGEFKENGTS